jgi:phage head maturation protease
MLQNVQQSMEARDLDIKSYEAEIKAYQAETQRISAVQAGMTEEQIQDIAMGVVAAAMESQVMMMPSVREAEEQPMMPEEPQMGMPQ